MKRKTLLSLLFLFVFVRVALAQNSPFLIWGMGLDGSSSQRAGIYADVNNGFLFDAPKDASGAKLPIQFKWREDNVPAFLISADGNVGIGTGTATPNCKFQVVAAGANGGNFQFDNIGQQAFFRMSNFTNWGLMMRSDINKPKIGAYYGGALVIHPFSSSAGDLDINRGALAVFNFADMRVGIGTTTPDAKLTVKGDIHAEEVRVDLNVPGPDYVFEEDYNLPSLSSIQNHIHKYKHLPGVPPAREMEEKGIEVGKMNMLLLEKVEELTLYILQQDQKITQLKEEQHSRETDLEVKIDKLMLQQEKLLEKLEAQDHRVKELVGN